VVVSDDAAAELGLTTADISADPTSIAALAGTLPATSRLRPYAACYGGHQFGSFAGQLGDGRAISLGEVLTAADDRWELQLKGAGPTPYSRRSDGFAVLRSSVREFLASEAMHALGVPTTRALSLCLSGREVVRGVHYDGSREPGAVVCRMAPSFIRFGSFEILYARGEMLLLEQLADYVIQEHFTQLVGRADRHAELLKMIVQRTARLAAAWQSNGFCHGVLNTDNMSVLGITLDYGPFSFLTDFDPSFTPNSSDNASRYSFQNQPAVCRWNLGVLATAFSPLLGEGQAGIQAAATVVEQHFDMEFANAMQRSHQLKLGLGEWLPGDNALLAQFFNLMEEDGVDFTQAFRSLLAVDPAAPAAELARPLEPALAQAGVMVGQRWVDWIEQFAARVVRDHDQSRVEQMRLASPRFILRNWQMQRAIEAAEAGAFGPLIELHDVLKRPFDEQPEYADYDNPNQDKARRSGVWQLS